MRRRVYLGSVEYVAVLEGGFAAVGGAKFIGAMIPPAAPLVGRLKYRRSICGETFGSDSRGVASGAAGPLAAEGSTGAEDGLAAGGNGLGALSAAMDGADGGKSGGGRGIRTRLVADGTAGRKRKGTGPTAGK
jgi:hypothetical protein